MQKLGNRAFESMQEFQVKASQDSKDAMSGMGVPAPFGRARVTARVVGAPPPVRELLILS